MFRRIILFITLLALLLPATAGAQTPPPSEFAETIRAGLLQAQLAFTSDPQNARELFEQARDSYDTALGLAMQAIAPEADQRVRAGLDAAETALAAQNAPAFSAARAQVWTALLVGGYQATEKAIRDGDPKLAQTWLPLREFRHATRFSRPNADATIALEQLAAGQISADDAIVALRADLLDTYQARLNEALDALADADARNFLVRRAEQAALADGYFAILAPSYAEQRGPDALATAQQAFATLSTTGQTQAEIQPAIARVTEALRGFRAAPLSPADQVRRAGQLLRFLSLVPVEYGRGVSNGVVTRDLEIREALTFRSGAAAAFTDLQTLLEARDAEKTSQVAGLLAQLDTQLTAAGSGGAVTDPAEIQGAVDTATALLREVMPEEWQRHDSSADFDVINTALDQMEAAVKGGEYDLAESARLEAYAILESGPEAKLIVFAPELKVPIEDLFWYGQGEHKGLAFLIERRAALSEIRASREALDLQLAAAQVAVGGQSAPLAVATNATIIVFREGLEAVLILASLMGSMKIGEQRRFRRPLWWGVVAAFVATVLTWLLAQGALTALARYGERLEAIVSLIAIAVLLLITNWFFHDVYWKGWMSNFHVKKRQIIGGDAGQWLGLVILGFTSIYREGFETVLFLQALVLEAGTTTVLGGVAAGLGGTLLVGLLVFALQAKLPHKKMLIVTGIMIGAVLLQMVGNTAHVMQVVGWLPAHPISFLTLPYWAGMWFGLYATWEGIGFQFASAVFVIGSYFLAERMQHRKLENRAPQPSRV